MDQDLRLTKQLLTLNETIEDLKWQKRYSYKPMLDSSSELTESDWSVSETDMYESESEVIKMHLKRSPETIFNRNRKAIDSEDAHGKQKEYLSSTVTVETEDIIKSTTQIKSEDSQPKPSRPVSISIETIKFLELPTEFDQFLNGNSSICGDQNSVDSGIHESFSWTDVSV